MNTEQIHLLLADDDIDDCLFFEEALSELSRSTRLTTVHDGGQLMQMLTKKEDLPPQVLFLDLNMPIKNGVECLSEIKRYKTLRELFVVIYSTSSEQNTVDLLYKYGAQYYIHKPSEFSELKKVIHQTLDIISEKLPYGKPACPVGWGGNFEQPSEENFVLTA